MIGVVILNYRTWEKTVSCVQSIYDTYPSPKEIVIVDNKSPNDSYERLNNLYPKCDYPDITIIQTDRNGGFSYGNNFGFDYITRNYPEISKVVITNNDIIFEEDAISNLTSSFSANENVVMTAPSIHDVNAKRTNAPWKCKPSIIQELGLKSTAQCTYQWTELTGSTQVYMVSGCCFAVDKDLFNKIGRFDDNVFLYNEENIISKKIADNGLKIIYSPTANIIHDHGSTTGNNSIFVDKEFVKSSLYFYSRYEGLNTFCISCIRWFYILRITLKIFLLKYKSTEGYFSAVKEIRLIRI